MFEVIFSNFFRLILVFLHFAYSVIQYLDLAKSFIGRKLTNLFRVEVCDAQQFVSNFVKNLKKCPSHFVVVVGADGIAFEDFSNLVTWCLAANISFISFYDYTGSLKDNKSIYFKYLVDERKLNPNCLNFASTKSESQVGVIPKIYLNILSLEDGKPLLVQLTKDITKRILLNKLQIADIHEEFIYEEILKISGLPEPDLAIICGTIYSTFGLLPWHIKVTEFLQVKTLKGIQVSDFTSILGKYSASIQRFGK